MTTTNPSLVDRLLAGDLRALSRLITRVEEQPPDLLPLIDGLWSHRGSAAVLGITGPPGSGKSTLTNQLVVRLRADGHRVAVLAVDPSSPFSGGAILGDRIRMQQHAVDPGVFIRSLGTRGHHGGLTRATLEAAVLCAAAGFDRVLIETVGVGQTELEIVGLADQVLVVLVPESGDVIQTMKAGLLEGADLFAVNKSDRPGADRLVQELTALGEEGADLAVGDYVAPPVFGISATEGTGLPEVFDAVCSRLTEGRATAHRLDGRALAARLAGQEAGKRLEEDAAGALAAGGRLAELGDALSGGQSNPYAVARKLLAGALET